MNAPSSSQPHPIAELYILHCVMETVAILSTCHARSTANRIPPIAASHLKATRRFPNSFRFNRYPRPPKVDDTAQTPFEILPSQRASHSERHTAISTSLRIYPSKLQMCILLSQASPMHSAASSTNTARALTSQMESAIHATHL